LKLQQRLLTWFKECLPECAPATIVADREFHSIHLASWIEKSLRLNFVLRIKAGTRVEYEGDWYDAGDLASRGRTRFWRSVKVTTDRQAWRRVNLVTVWDRDQEEPWLLITNFTWASYRLYLQGVSSPWRRFEKTPPSQGPALIESQVYQAADDDLKAKMLERLSERTNKLANERRPDLGQLDADSIAKGIRKSEKQEEKKRERSRERLIYATAQ